MFCCCVQRKKHNSVLVALEQSKLTMPKTIPGPISIEERMSLKKIRMSASTSGHLRTQTKKPRRSTHPLRTKESKSARLQAEDAAKAVADTCKNRGVLVAKLKLLEKLVARQQAAGKQNAARETQQQVDDLKRDLRMLELDVKALQEGPQELAGAAE